MDLKKDKFVLTNCSLQLPLRSVKSTSIKRSIVSYLLPRLRMEQKFHNAIQNISLDIQHGDKLGIIGRNGSGKTTLLRLLSGELEPNSGHIRRPKFINSFINLQSGFQLEASGRENTELKYLMLRETSLSRTEFIKKVEITAELKEFFNQPLYTYSTGMLARLSFAMAIANAGDVLILDEWLSVGDFEFQKKAEKILERKLEADVTLIMASHSKEILARVCDRFLYLGDGKKIEIGGSEVLDSYFSEPAFITN